VLSLNRKKSAPDASDPSAEQPPTAAAKEAPKAKSGPYRIIALAVVIVINAAWVFWSYQTFVLRENERKLLVASEFQAKQGAERVEFHVKRLQGVLHQFSQRQALLTALADDNSDLTSWQASLLQSLPAESQAALLRTFDSPESQYPNFDFRFAELDMINRAKRNETPLPEVGSRDKQAAVTLVVPALATAEDTLPIAVIVARVPVRHLKAALEDNGAAKGGYELLQSFANTQAKTVVAVGSGFGPAVVTKINDLWSLQFQANAELIESVNTVPYLIYASWLLVLVATLAVALWLAGRQEEARQARALAAAVPGQDAIQSVQLAEEDRDLMAGASTGRGQPQAVKLAAPVEDTFPAQVFRAYDVRGLAGSEINAEFARQLGKALGSRIIAGDSSKIFVGRDGRQSSPELCQALVEGLISTGVTVLDLGLIPSPLLYYAVATREDCHNGVIVTASHNGAKYNGFKITLDGLSLASEAIQELRRAMESNEFAVGEGKVQEDKVVDDYIDEILADVALMGDVRMVIDAANGATSEVAPLLFGEMGCEVIPLYCEVDGSFPNHDPDPSNEANLQDLIAKVREEQADLGVAFDGDGDRIFVVTESGAVITPDRLLMLFARDIVSRNPGTDVVYDVKCTRQLGALISSYGGRPIMWKTGHANMKQKILETGALLGGEFSGHIFIKDRWYGFDDGMLVAARLLEIMSLREQGLDEIFEAFPVLPATPEIRIPVPESKKFSIIQTLVEQGDFQSGTPSTIDGLRVDFAKGWGLVRASNTGPELTLRFEGETEEVIDQLKMLFKRELTKIDDSLDMNF